MPKRIAILFHEHYRKYRARMDYAICHMATYWREAGHEVTFVFGVKQFIPADLAILHVDLSEVPDDYLEFSRRYPLVVNGAVKDVRKSTFSKHLLRAHDSYAGRVIVKSDLNYAGLPERLLVERKSRFRIRIANWLRSFDNVRARDGASWFGTSTHYRVYESLRDVPSICFESHGLVVEKFLPEMDGGLYCVRFYNFLGDRMTSVRIASKDPIVKSHNKVSRMVVEPHPDIVKLRSTLKFDFGKFDYVVLDGCAIPLDVNKTPGEGSTVSPEAEARLRYRASGLYSFL